MLYCPTESASLLRKWPSNWNDVLQFVTRSSLIAPHFEISKLHMFCLVYVFFTSPSKQMLVQAGTGSCAENFCSSLWSHSFVTQSLSEKIYPSRLVCHARYPKALLEGGHDCRLAVRRLWHLKAVSRLTSAHETLMKWVFPKRWHSREQRKTIISRIKARESKT